MKEWISEHPYLAGVLALVTLVLLYLILHRGSSGGGQQAVSSGPSAGQLQAGIQSQQTAAAVQVSQGAQAVQLAQTVAAAGVENNKTQAARDVALQQILTGGSVANYNAAAQVQLGQSHDAASVANTTTNANASVGIASINADAAVKVAGIQGDVSKFTVASQLQGLLDTNKTSLDIAGLSLEGLKDTNASSLAALRDTNASRVAVSTSADNTAARISAGQDATRQLAITTTGDITKLQIAGQNQTVADQFSLAQQRESDIYGPGGIFVGINRYGGNLQSNQATIEAAILGQPGVGQAIQQTSASEAQSSASIWGKVVDGIFGTVKTVAAAGL